jgi:hypothetical protein
MPSMRVLRSIIISFCISRGKDATVQTKCDEAPHAKAEP